VRGRLGILAAAAALGPAACGGGDTRTAVPVDSVTPAPTPAVTVTATATPPEATAPSAPSPPPDAPSPPPSPTSGEGQAGGGGDEAAARVPVELTVGSDGTVTPPTVSVPAFLALELRVRNRTAGTLSVTMEHADPPGAFEVGAGKTGTRRLAGVRPGRYVIAVAGAGRATLVAGAEPGP
jgi:hypothetical protein